MALWPSDGMTALLIFGLSGILMIYASWRFWEAQYGFWLGAFMVFASVYFFLEVNKERQEAIRVFQSDSKVELIGEVSEIQIKLLNSSDTGSMRSNAGFHDVDSPWRHNVWPTKARSRIRFNVGQEPVYTSVNRLSFQSGNKCNFWSCGLEAGDRVRVSTSEEYRLPFSLNDMALRIERCDDKL